MLVVNSFTICKLGLPSERCFLVLHQNIAFLQSDFGRAHFVRKRIVVRGTLPCLTLKYRVFQRVLSTSLTAQVLFALKIRRTRTQIAIPCECLLGEVVRCTQADKRILIQGLLINGMC